MTIANMVEMRRRYTGRRRAREAVTSLSRLGEFGDIRVKVYVIDDDGRLDNDAYIVLDVEVPQELVERAEGALAMGMPFQEAIWTDGCLEFYSGRGVTRFRGA